MIQRIQSVYQNGATIPVGLVPLEPSPAPLSWPRGEDGSIVVDVVDPTGAPFDLTGYTAKLGVRLFPFDTAPLFAKTGTIGTPANGSIAFPIAGADVNRAPDRYRWDAWATKISDGTRHQIQISSTFEITEADLLPTE